MKGPVLAVDHGTKRTGFATTDALRIATRPLEVWSGAGNSQQLIDRVIALTLEREATHLIVGYPLHMDGAEGGRAKDVQVFVDALAARLPGVQIVKQDERLSTKSAEALLREAGYFGDERKARRDSWSALVILRDWIESGEPD